MPTGKQRKCTLSSLSSVFENILILSSEVFILTSEESGFEASVFTREIRDFTFTLQSFLLCIASSGNHIMPSSTPWERWSSIPFTHPASSPRHNNYQRTALLCNLDFWPCCRDGSYRALGEPPEFFGLNLLTADRENDTKQLESTRTPNCRQWRLALGLGGGSSFIWARLGLSGPWAG